jgi:3-hydroxy-3-methylglutaryl CoA synthase
VRYDVIGIKSYGAYIPLYRLSQEAIAQAWGRPGRRGEKAVANFDEDSLTMATESSLNCLARLGKDQVDGIYFASTTPPYREKQTASILATALDLDNPLRAADFAGSLRSGTIALRSAMDAVQGGGLKGVLVSAADCRLAEPGGDLEPFLGDASAALLLGDSDVAVEIEAAYTQYDDFLDSWRKAADTYVVVGDSRFAQTCGYMRNMEQAARALLDETDLNPSDFTKAVLHSPDARSHLALGKRLGFESSQLQDPLLGTVGHCGAGHALLMLVAALEEARPGDRLLFLSYGDGCDAFVLRATEKLEGLRKGRGLKAHLETRRALPSYQKYLKFRGLLLEDRAFAPFSSPIIYWREQRQYLRFHGVRCRSCGRTQYPMVRVCRGCGAKDNFDEVGMAKTGQVFSFEADHYFPSPNPPTIMAEVDLDGGGRALLQMTDCDPATVQVGMPVELTLRNYHQGGKFVNYYWKCRPVREVTQ